MEAPNQASSNPTNSQPQEDPASSSKRVNVVFSADQFEKLQKLANSQKISLSDALRQAISLSTIIVDANEDPDTQILFKRGNNVQELRLVR
jgi:hypothetical protein